MYLYGNDLGDPASNDEQGKCKCVLCGEQKRRSCAKPRQNKSNASLSLEQRKGETQKKGTCSTSENVKQNGTRWGLFKMPTEAGGAAPQ